MRYIIKSGVMVAANIHIGKIGYYSRPLTIPTQTTMGESIVSTCKQIQKRRQGQEGPKQLPDPKRARL
jgi:hypothetical protein